MLTKIFQVQTDLAVSYFSSIFERKKRFRLSTIIDSIGKLTIFCRHSILSANHSCVFKRFLFYYRCTVNVSGLSEVNVYYYATMSVSALTRALTLVCLFFFSINAVICTRSLTDTIRCVSLEGYDFFKVDNYFTLHRPSFTAISKTAVI